MKPVLELAEAALEGGETCVLCTVVRLDGSGYGRPGARMLMTQECEGAGYISGGCLERDLCHRAWSATQNGPRLIAFDTRGNSLEASRYSSGCEGVVYVLCQRIEKHDCLALVALIASLREQCKVRLLTVYRSESPQFQTGDMWMFKESDQGNDLRSSSSRSLPVHVLNTLLEAEAGKVITFADEQGQLIDAAIEILNPPRQIIVFGAGDDVVPVYSACANLGYELTIVGDRPELASQLRFPGAKVHSGPWGEVVRNLKLYNHVDVLMMTHDLVADVELLPHLLASPVRSIGLLGSKRRLGRVIRGIYDRGCSLNEADLQRIRSPLGLDIGANTAEEIAVSIVAELIAMPNARSGRELHARQEPIHAN